MNTADDLLLGTHIALWLDDGDKRLKSSTRAMINACWQNGGTVFVSAVTAWEIAQLVLLGRIDLELPVDAWIDRFAAQPASKSCP